MNDNDVSSAKKQSRTVNEQLEGNVHCQCYVPSLTIIGGCTFSSFQQ